MPHSVATLRRHKDPHQLPGRPARRLPPTPTPTPTSLPPSATGPGRWAPPGLDRTGLPRPGQFGATKPGATRVPGSPPDTSTTCPSNTPTRLARTAHPEQGATLPNRRSVHRPGDGPVLTRLGGQRRRLGHLRLGRPRPYASRHGGPGPPALHSGTGRNETSPSGAAPDQLHRHPSTPTKEPHPAPTQDPSAPGNGRGLRRAARRKPPCPPPRPSPASLPTFSTSPPAQRRRFHHIVLNVFVPDPPSGLHDRSPPL